MSLQTGSTSSTVIFFRVMALLGSWASSRSIRMLARTLGRLTDVRGDDAATSSAESRSLAGASRARLAEKSSVGPLPNGAPGTMGIGDDHIFAPGSLLLAQALVSDALAKTDSSRSLNSLLLLLLLREEPPYIPEPPYMPLLWRELRLLEALEVRASSRAGPFASTMSAILTTFGAPGSSTDPGIVGIQSRPPAAPPTALAAAALGKPFHAAPAAAASSSAAKSSSTDCRA
mmetsp:Transcript_59408/g.181231  ORF Transcript_59408/g.181231 Transcript_59408/m.181231 type:complete len:231 (+) Transcript_59408:2098-2790(+)